jgi:hypothetical protein
MRGSKGLRALSAYLVVTAMLNALPAASAGAETGRDLETIWTKCVDDNATGYATFQSNNQKVVSNRRGYFMAYIRSRNEAYTAQQWRLIWSQDGGRNWTVLHEATNATNPAVLETDSRDNVYLMRPDWEKQTWSENSSLLYRFLASDDYSKPIITEIPGSVHGKYALEIDERRGQLYFFSANEWFFVIGLDGKIRHSARLMHPGEHAWLQYTNLDLDTDGTLYAGWTTQKKDVYLYWDIHCAKSPDGGRTWLRLDGTPLTLSFAADDSGPTDLISRPEEFEVHSWLWSLLAKAGKLHFTYQIQGQPEATQRYVRYDLRTAQPDVDLTPRFGGETLPMCRLDGYFASDDRDPSSPLYCVGNSSPTSNRVTAIISHDNGVTWHDYAQSRHTFGSLYAIGGCRQVTADGHVIGSCTDQWSQPPRVIFFKFRVARASG